MAEPRRTVMATVGATGGRGRLTSDTGKVPDTSYTALCGGMAQVLDTSRVNCPSHQIPQFGPLLSDSFMSQTKRHYQPHIRSDCSGSLPNLINRSKDSGLSYLRCHPKAVATEEKTDYQRRFVPHHLTTAVSQNHVTIGPKGKTGFTEGTDLRLNTFQEKNSTTVQVEPPQTLSSVMKNDFLPPPPLQGTEAILGTNSHSCRESGYTRGAIAPLACPSSLLPSAHTTRNAPTSRALGRKELTGHLQNALNNQIFPNTPFDRSQFTTHYKSSFCHGAELEKLRHGHIGAGIIGAKMDSGYNRRDMDRFMFRD